MALTWQDANYTTNMDESGSQTLWAADQTGLLAKQNGFVNPYEGAMQMATMDENPAARFEADALRDWMAGNGYKSQWASDGGYNYQRLVDAAGNQVGDPLSYKVQQDNVFGAAMLAAAGLATAGVASWAGAGAGAAGAGTASGASTAAGTTAAAGGGTGALGMGVGYTVPGLAAAAPTVSAGLLPAGVSLASLAQAGSSLAGLYSSIKATQNQNAALDAQLAATQGLTNIAQEQWDFQKNTYLPKALDLAERQAGLAEKVANAQLEDAAYYRGISQQTLDQAKKSWEFQDQYMQMARDYASGKTGNTMADEANADVHQAFQTTTGDMVRTAQRYGINPGSGAFTGALADRYNEEALAGAGAQTMARRQARDKAEQMVGIAAGAGAAGFGTGLGAGQLATGAGNAAVQAGSAAGNSFNQLNAGMATNYNGIGTNYALGGRTGYGMGQTYGGSPTADFISGAFNSALQSGIFGQTNKP